MKRAAASACLTIPVARDAPLDEAGPMMAQLQALLPDRFAEQPRLLRLAAGDYTTQTRPGSTGRQRVTG